jgi:phosphate transport system substrate-binding protein
VQALLAGKLDMVVSSKSLTPEQSAKGLQLHRFGKSPLLVVTERMVPQKDVTTRELEDIYAGRLRQWPNGERIRVVLRPLEDVDSQILRGLSHGMNDALNKSRTMEGVMFAATDPESDETVSRTPGAIGTAALVSVISGKRTLNILSLNGVKGSLQTLSHGNYPLTKYLNFVTTSHPSPAVSKFLAFVFSPQGRAIAEKTGVMILVDEKERP